MVKIQKNSQLINRIGKVFIDISKNVHYAYGESPNGDKLSVFSFDNNKQGFE